jgi:ribosomal protein S18 acetylase RimI-like enzyme
MEESLDYPTAIDQMNRTRRMPDYGERYTRKLSEEIDKNDGIAYVAELDDQIVGFAAGRIHKQSEIEMLECIPSRDGRVIELFADAQYRRRNVGTLLIQKMEEYFREKGCDVSRVEVFEPNVNAHRLYRKLGYSDRIIDMVKKL